MHVVTARSVEWRSLSQMRNARGGLHEVHPRLRLKYISEIKQPLWAPDDWQGACIQAHQSGGIDEMEALLSHIRDEHDPAVQIRVESLGELQDAISQNLTFFYKRAHRYVGDPHDAEDAVQDALLSAYKHLDQFKGTAKLTTWLTSIVTNSALTHLRRRGRHPHISVDERISNEHEHYVSDTLADVRPNPEGEYIRSDSRRHLLQAIAKLSPPLREAIQLCDLDGLTTKEAADFVGVPLGTFKSRVLRARRKLKWMIHKR
jgi:RNA polymerase sigma-70 factor (ECF subfamily)